MSRIEPFGYYTAGPAAGEPLPFRTIPLSDVIVEDVRWLWRNRIPLGKITMLDGDPGVGKSTLAITIGAKLTTGCVWPDGDITGSYGDVLMLSGEDGLADTIKPRFVAAGGNAERFHILDAALYSDPDTGDLVETDATLATLHAVEEAIAHHGAILLIVDVLTAFLPSGTDSHRDQDIRSVLRPLAAIAERTGCAILLLRHLNKSGGGNAMYRGGGSIGITGAARSGLLVARDPDDPELVVLASIKNNLGPKPPAVGYRLVDWFGAGKVEWHGVVAREAHELLGGDSDPEQDDALVRFLVEFLRQRGGQTLASEATKAIHDNVGRVSEATIRRARRRARIRTVKGGMLAGWVWSLPEEK